MKRKHALLLALVLALGLAPLLPGRVLADYDLTKMQVTAEVNADGSLSMARKIDYDFSSSANGVYYTQSLGQGQKVSQQSVEIKDLGSGKKFRPVLNNQAESGNVYHFVKEGNSYKFKVYHRVSEGKVQVVYRYRISGAVDSYQDASELNFKIIGSGWDKDISDVTATVRFKRQHLSFLKGWAHVNASGHLTVDPEKGLVQAKVATLPEETFLELHLLFPNSLVEQNQRRHAGEIVAKVVAQEKDLAKESAAKKTRQRTFEKIGLVLLAMASLLYLPIFFKTRKSGVKVRSKKELGHNFALPSFSPTVAQMLVTRKAPDSAALSAEIAMRAGQGELTIAPEKKGKEDNFRYAKTSKYRGDLPLLNKLFKKVGNGKSFTNEELAEYGNSEGIVKSYKKWQEASQQALISEGYVDQQLQSLKNKLTAYACGVMFLGVAVGLACFFLYEESDQNFCCLFLVMALNLLGFALSLVRLHYFSCLTEKGAAATEHAIAFKQMLNDIGQFKLRDIGELILWEQIMPYAMAFGLAKKVLKQLKLEFPEEVADDPYWACYYAGSIGGFATSFDEAISSSAGSGGSFSASDVSSGGFGGDSGGGAF